MAIRTSSTALPPPQWHVTCKLIVFKNWWFCTPNFLLNLYESESTYISWFGLVNLSKRLAFKNSTNPIPKLGDFTRHVSFFLGTLYSFEHRKKKLYYTWLFDSEGDSLLWVHREWQRITGDFLFNGTTVACRILSKTKYKCILRTTYMYT
jgi:hypothetical protein